MKAGGTLIVQFAKVPRIGAVKTRMLGALSAGDACELHWDLMRWTWRRLRKLQNADVELWLSDAPDAAVARRLREAGMDEWQLQCGEDLGKRMNHALTHGLERYARVLLVGSDCPGIDSDYLVTALDALERVDVVVGPALDGGYVLLGLREPRPTLFDGVSWGQSTVFGETVARIKSSSLAWFQLEGRQDIDRPEDLPAWEALQASQTGQSG